MPSRDEPSNTPTNATPLPAAEPSLGLPDLPVPRTAPPRGRLQSWLYHGGTPDAPAMHEHGHPWYRVLWLTGVDYFSTLGYQPGIALLAAGVVSPIATLILIVVTLLGALPVYAQVAGRSFVGQGSIAMLESLLPGWSGKIMVLVLLGFATTDFVITMTLSAADAAQHAVENPFLHPYIGDAQMWITLLLLALLTVVFLKGFKEAIGLAGFITIPYLLLNVIVLGRCGLEILRHPEHVQRWSLDLTTRGDPGAILLAAAIIFPKLALGMSGFETGVAVMPLVSNRDPRGQGDEHEGEHTGEPPQRRIRGTRKLLASAALIMSVFLLGSSWVTTMLLTPADVGEGGAASGRALAFLAHTYLGHGFGSVYDVATLLILWFAGASAMAGMLNLVPRYLPRFGMAPRWVAFARPLVLVLFVLDVLVTLVFHADVEAQGGAYATGVLVLMLSAGIAVALAIGRESRLRPRNWRGRTLAGYFWLVSAVLGFTLVDNVVERPDGVIVASVFIGVILVLGAWSRYARTTELRVERLVFADRESAEVFPRLVGKKVHLVTVKDADPRARRRKRDEMHRHYRVTGAIAFVHVSLLDNRSEFMAPVQVFVRQLDDDFILELTGAVAVANCIAYLSELIDPVGIFLVLTRQNPMTQALRYFLFGEGEVGLSVYSILIRYWKWTPEDDVRPFIFLMTE